VEIQIKDKLQNQNRKICNQIVIVQFQIQTLHNVILMDVIIQFNQVHVILDMKMIIIQFIIFYQMMEVV